MFDSLTAANIAYETTSARLKLLAHPERLRLLDALRRGAGPKGLPVCHLEALLGKPQPYVSQQLRLLREAGVIEDERRGQLVYYRLRDADVRGWLDAVLGPAEGEHPEIARARQVVSCECPRCDTGLAISFFLENGTAEVQMDRVKVLFLCTGNSARSQMAEALLRIRAGDRYEVHSAGLEPKGMNPYTVRVMEEMGADMSGHRSKDLREYLGFVHFGYVFTVCNHAEEACPSAFLNSGNHLHWDIEDPAAFRGTDEETLAKFRAIRDDLDGRIRDWVAHQN